MLSSWSNLRQSMIASVKFEGTQMLPVLSGMGISISVRFPSGSWRCLYPMDVLDDWGSGFKVFVNGCNIQHDILPVWTLGSHHFIDVLSQKTHWSKAGMETLRAMWHCFHTFLGMVNLSSFHNLKHWWRKLCFLPYILVLLTECNE